MIPITTKEAVFSGYTISPNDFKALLRSMHESIKKHHVLDDDDILDTYIIAYDAWRRRLEGDLKAKAPTLRLIFKQGKNKDKDYDTTVEKFIFPVRCSPYENDEQMQNDSSLRIPNEAETAKLEEFALLVTSLGGEFPERSKLGFDCIKDVHPSQEWRNW